MSVRNFWVECNVDGRQNPVTGGPRCKDGGLNFRLYQRDNGETTTALKVVSSEWDGVLITEVYAEGKLIHKIETKR